MLPYRTIKTYSKKSKSVDAINALFAQNLTKRFIGRKKKPKSKPKRTEPYLTDSLLTFNAEETFDKVRKGRVFQEVKVSKNVHVYNSSSDTSKSRIAQVSVNFHSPIMTRRRVKQNTAAVSSDESEQEPLVHTNKSSTLDKAVTSSLFIEKETQKQKALSLSYIHLPKVVEEKVIFKTCDNTDKMEAIFSDTFRERQTVHSSTPCVIVPFEKIVADPISPICKSDPNSSKLIEKSYDEIRKWDSNFPILENEETPKGPVLRSSTRPVGISVKVRRRKSITRNCYREILRDWKLNIEPKVYLKSSDIIDFKTIDQKLHFQPKVFVNCDNVADFKGFTEKEKLQSTKYMKDFQSINQQVFQSGHRKTKSMFHTTKQFSRKPVENRTVNNNKMVTSSKKSVNYSVDCSDSIFEDSFGKCSGNSNMKFSKTKKHKCVSDNLNNKKSKLTVKQISGSEEEFHTRKVHKNEQNKIESNFAHTDKCFVTLRRYKVNVKNNNQHISNNKQKYMQFKNVTEDILSEKEVSYSSIAKCKSDFGKTISEVSVITQSSTDELSPDLKQNVLKFSKEQTKEKNLCPVVKLENWDTCAKMSCVKDKFDETSNNQIENLHQKSIISISDDDLNFYENVGSVDFQEDSKNYPITYSVNDLTHDQELCLPQLNVHQKFNELLLINGSMKKSSEETTQNCLENIAEELRSSTVLEKSIEMTPYKLPLRSSRSLDFIIPSRNASRKIEYCKNRRSSAKIIILSDISLGVGSRLDSSKIYQDLYHDHSYTNLPEPDSNQHLYDTAVNSGQNDVHFLENQYIDSSCNLSDIIESSCVSSGNMANAAREDRGVAFKKPVKKMNKPKTIALRPGKTYRRSLLMFRRSSVFDDVLSTDVCPDDCLCATCLFRGKLNGSSCRRSFQIVPATPRGTLPSNSSLETYARKRYSYVQEQDLINTDLDNNLRNLSLISNSRNLLINHCDNSLPDDTAKDIVLRRCGQTEILPFEECYPRSLLQNCQKIGEGVYGEVFLYRNQSGGTSVMKIIPIEGVQTVNLEKQKKFDEIVSEIVISMELSNLRNNKKNFTSCFTEVQKVRCVRGSYPDRLLDLWDLFAETRGSENESPAMFPPDQLYIVLELSNGGQDLESFVFNNALQVFAVFKQTACALAVAESQLKFEHRDLHWGNILISSVDKNKTLHFRLNGIDIEIDTHGVEVSIIDFTLSRAEFDGVVIFNDLSRDDELFVAKGDYQFEIYRLMQQNNSNEWQHFEPYSNILWLHYLLDKAVTSALRYKNNRTKIHKEYLGKLRKLKEQILSFQSVVEFVISNFI